MRNINRIMPFMNEFGELWKQYFPDWRFGQLCSNFYGWLAEEKQRDLFFSEEDEMLQSFREYCESNSPLCRKKSR